MNLFDMCSQGRREKRVCLKILLSFSGEKDQEHFDYRSLHQTPFSVATIMQ